MEENVFESYDAIDAKLDEEFGEVANEPEEQSEEMPVEDTTEVEEENSSSEEKEEPTEEVTQPEDEGNSESKKDHAFADLRAENSNIRKERDTYKTDSDYLRELAASYGYDDISKFKDAVNISRYQREAQEKGYDPVLYRKAMEQERRIAELEREKDEEITQRKLERFKNALDKAVVEYEVDEKEIFNRLEEAGIAVDDILNINNPKLIIDGVLIDKIQNNAKQSQIKDLQNLKSLAEDKNEQSGSAQTVTIDSLLKDDLAAYKRENFL